LADETETEKHDPRKGAKHVLSNVERRAKVPQIPLVSPLKKGDERGISGFLCMLGARTFCHSGWEHEMLEINFHIRECKRLKVNTAAAILVFLWMVLPGSGSAAERKSDLRITYSPPHISVEARGVKLREVLREVSLTVGFELTDYGIPDRDLTVSIEETTVEELLRQLLRGENYGLIYREKDRAISKVLLLSSPVYAQAAPMSENRQIRTEASRGSEGLTVFSNAPSYQPARLERKRETRAESEPGIEDILRVHAMPGVAGSSIFPQNVAPNVSQPLGRSTPAFSPTGAASLNAQPLGDMSNSLAVTTRVAQQNLKALVDGLASATHSLLSSPPQK
jgi:hypothetical protein